MTPRAIRRWSMVHSWSSLICTAFLLMLCVTGLPLIFHDEIDAALDASTWAPANPDGPLLDLDTLLEQALGSQPGEYPIFMSFDVDRPVVNVTTGPRPDAPASAMHFASYDRTSGEVVPGHEDGVMDFILQLHTDLFLGLPGMLFLGSMGLLFVVAIISGVVLYAPFMRRQSFGVLRTGRPRRARVGWLDWHDLTGVVTVAWALMVGLSGVINTLEQPIIDGWKHDQLADLTAAYGDTERPARLASLDAAVTRAQAVARDMQLQFVAFPGGRFATDHHYAVFFHGGSPLTENLITPALIDARTGELVGVREMPWYAKALSLSRPLHFGDYGGLPLKILWALLTLVTLAVLVSGLVLWVRRRAASAPPVEVPAGALAAEAG